MSEFKVEVGRVCNVQKHPDADTLSTCEVFGYPVVIRTGEFNEGDLAVYVPVDSVMPADDARFDFLKGKLRIRAARLRGIYSQGLLVKPEPGWIEGQDVREAMRITKWEPEMGSIGPDTENEAGPEGVPVYTDIEGYRRHPNELHVGEELVITEKVHGANARFGMVDGRMYAGSRVRFKRPDPDNLWWKAVAQNELEKKVARAPGFVFYGEVYGQVQRGFQYGAKQGQVFFRAFDVWDIAAQRYLDFDDFVVLAAVCDIETMPVLWRGLCGEAPLDLRNGASMIPGASNIREGFVVKPTHERTSHMGRVVLKLVGENYLLSKHS